MLFLCIYTHIYINLDMIDKKKKKNGGKEKRIIAYRLFSASSYSLNTILWSSFHVTKLKSASSF